MLNESWVFNRTVIHTGGAERVSLWYQSSARINNIFATVCVVSTINKLTSFPCPHKAIYITAEQRLISNQLGRAINYFHCSFDTYIWSNIKWVCNRNLRQPPTTVHFSAWLWWTPFWLFTKWSQDHLLAKRNVFQATDVSGLKSCMVLDWRKHQF